MDEDPKPYGVIYFILNKINGKCYVGQTTKRIEERWWHHVNGAKHAKGTKKDTYFCKAIRYWGPDTFEVRVIFNCYEEETLKSSEIFFISLFDSSNSEFGYNGTLGGTGGVPSNETKKKISKALTGRHPTEEARKNLSIARKKQICTEEHKDNIRKALTGIPFSEERKEKISKKLTGRKLSEEHKKAIKDGHARRNGKNLE